MSCCFAASGGPAAALQQPPTSVGRWDDEPAESLGLRGPAAQEMHRKEPCDASIRAGINGLYARRKGTSGEERPGANRPGKNGLNTPMHPCCRALHGYAT